MQYLTLLNFKTMTKIVMLAGTLNRLPQAEIEALVKSGEIKKTEEDIPYLLIADKDKETEEVLTEKIIL